MMPKAKKIFRPVISLLVVLCLSLGLAALDPQLGQRAENDLHLVRLAPALMGEFDASILDQRTCSPSPNSFFQDVLISAPATVDPSRARLVFITERVDRLACYAAQMAIVIRAPPCLTPNF